MECFEKGLLFFFEFCIIIKSSLFVVQMFQYCFNTHYFTFIIVDLRPNKTSPHYLCAIFISIYIYTQHIYNMHTFACGMYTGTYIQYAYLTFITLVIATK